MQTPSGRKLQCLVDPFGDALATTGGYHFRRVDGEELYGPSAFAVKRRIR